MVTAQPIAPVGSRWPRQRRHRPRYGRALTEHFLVVHWDQRGSGKPSMDDTAPFTIEQLAKDAQELIVWLLHRCVQPDLPGRLLLGKRLRPRDYPPGS